MNRESIELRSLPTTMDRLKAFLQPSLPAYATLDAHAEEDDEAEDGDNDVEGSQEEQNPGSPFSWLEYAIFVLLGMAMLWAWYVGI